MTVAVLPAAGERPALAGRRALVLAVCCTSLFLTGFDSTAVMIGLPAVGRSLHAGVAGLQWSVTAYTVTLASLLMSAGVIADRFGRRTVFQAGLAVFILGSWLCSIAPSLAWLIAFRAVQGAGAAGLNPAALGIISNVFRDPAGKARAIGVWDGVYGLSLTLGPVAGGVLVSAAGWRGIFWANIPVGLGALCLTSVAVPESRAERPPRPDPAAQALVAVLMAALATAIIQGPDWGWRSPRTAGLLAAAALALAVLAAWERHRADPMIEPAMFRSLPFSAAAVTAVCAVAAMAGFLFLTTLYLQDVRGMPVLRAALTIAPMPAEMAVCAPLASRVIARRGCRIPALAGGAAITASCLVLARLTRSSSPGYLAVAYSLFGLGAGCASPAITYGIMSGLPARTAGLASGIASTGRQLGQCLGVAVTGTVLAARLHGPVAAGFLASARPGWFVMAGCGLVVLAAGAASAPRRAAAAARLSPARSPGRHARPRGIPPPLPAGTRTRPRKPRARHARRHPVLAPRRGPLRSGRGRPVPAAARVARGLGGDEEHPVPAAVLGRVQRAVGGEQEVVKGPGDLAGSGHADRHGHAGRGRVAGPGHGDGDLGDDLAEPLGYLSGHGGRGVGEQEREFLTADPADQVAFAEDSHGGGGDRG